MKEDKIQPSNYHEVYLDEEDAAVLYELEEILGLKIPSGKCGFYSTGFIYEDQKIIG